MDDSQAILIGQTGRALVVDDEEQNRELLRDLLEAQGHEVIEAENGKQALQKVMENPPDVILLDVMMPGLNGFEVCRRLKADPKTAPIPILLVTVLTDRSDRLAGIEAGANDFLSKPIDREDLLPRVRNAIYTKRLFDQMQESAEERIEASLEEKEVLLREIHHRVKNNMQIISSLLGLQRKYITDEQALEIFTDSQQRIRSMALVHNKLYQSENLAKIDFTGYIESLTSTLFQAYATTDNISFSIDVEDIQLSIDVAIPCGLILNELVSNSLKHAFPEGTPRFRREHPENRGKECEIKITLRSADDNDIELIVSDNGVGIPEDLDFRNTESLGLQLVVALVNQLEGNIELNRTAGTEFRIKFKAGNSH